MRACALGCGLLGLLAPIACGEANVAVPPALVLESVTPHHGATGVPTSSSAELVFDAPLDTGLLTSDRVQLQGPAGSLACRRLLSTDQATLTLVPERVLQADTAFEIVVDHGLRGQGTGELGITFRSRFHTGR